MRRVLFFLLSVLALNACRKSGSQSEIGNGDIVLAKVKDNKLLFSQIPTFQLNNMRKEDSIAFLKSYINNWIKEETFILRAVKNIKDFSEIENKTKQFKKDLLRASYERDILQNTIFELTEEDIIKYYEEHSEYFVFKEDYYELNYILLPKNTSGIQQIRKNISENRPSAFVESYCGNNPEQCFLDESVLKNEFFLRNTLKLQKKALKVSTRYRYFYPSSNSVLIYKIISKKNKGEKAPLKLIINEVSAMALENLKHEYIEKIENETYQKAKNNEIFDIYID